MADDVTRPRPDRQPFALEAERLGVDPECCLVVENAPFGMQAAHLAGCRTSGICATPGAEDLQGAGWIVQGHDELARLLAS
jgi:beta-phosphoglucomutase-like phosphatase (HAD superfamily)